MSNIRLIKNGNVIPTIDNLSTAAVVVESRPMDFGRPDADKYIDHIILGIEYDVPFVDAVLQYAVGDRLRDVKADRISWRTYGSVSTPDNPIYRRVTGRYFVFRFVDNYPQQRWKLFMMQWFGEVLGTRNY